MDKKKVIVGACALALLGGGTTWFLTRPKTEDLTLTSKQVSKKTQDSSKEQTKVESPYKIVKKTLEKPDEVVNNDDLKSAISSMISGLTQANSEVYPNREQHTLLSNAEDLEKLKKFLDTGYTYQSDKTEMFSSNNSGIQQFLIILTKENDEVVFSGNYDELSGQIQLATYRYGEVK